MKHEYHEGPKAKEKFEKGMTALFRVPKETVTVKELKPKTKPKPRKTSKD